MAMPNRGSEPVPQTRGCLFYGGVVVIVSVVLGVVGMFFLMKHALDHLGEHVAAAVEPYTETAARIVPESLMPREAYEALERRVSEFITAVDAGRSAKPLVLTGDDINALIAQHPSFVVLRGRVSVSVVGEELAVEFAMPLDDVATDGASLSPLKGRFLNGSASLAPSVVDGEPVIKLRALELSKPLPADVMRELLSVDLMYFVKTEPWLAYLDDRSIQIGAGRVTIAERTPK